MKTVTRICAVSMKRRSEDATDVTQGSEEEISILTSGSG